ncbi:hypothetical protein AAFF_G00290600 [Aldrovandia affinis]|uniref:Uncharacterized protein n=1 Tax=Aldrovandia affinis TaxID=143900 RepID=A0AAD7RA40_9TELE|nr:hypothetical protein AAFF_G00290600 [Aldrovandia affinis]
MMGARAPPLQGLNAEASGWSYVGRNASVKGKAVQSMTDRDPCRRSGSAPSSRATAMVPHPSVKAVAVLIVRLLSRHQGFHRTAVTQRQHPALSGGQESAGTAG